ncbi:hypothetical protein AC249_AIPGENE26517 [Exaiptasia diaphana]|nr:hypothetical protein AC249_AIPGENE26517 [Exaiptasia diaphana]
MASPVKSVSVRGDESGNYRALHVKQTKNKYLEVTNFHFVITAFVEFPVRLARMNGYLLDVHRKDGRVVQCFVTCEEVQSVKSFVSAINRTFSKFGGVMFKNINDDQLREFIMKDLTAFQEGGMVTKKAAVTIGLQEDGETYIFNKDVQTISPRILTDFKVPKPLTYFEWTMIMEKFKEFFTNNFLSFVIFLAGAMSAFHYQKVLQVLGSCPAPMAVGETASGKSTCLRLIKELLGGSIMSQCSGESVSSELIRSTLPVYWDDPSHANTLKKVLVSTFQGGGKQTKKGGNENPLSTFLITVNFTLDDDLRSFERTTPIFFSKILDGGDFIAKKKSLFEMASRSCLPSIIRLGSLLREANLQEHISYFKERLKGMPSRLPNIYSVYRFFLYLSILAVEDIDDYLEETLLPHVRQQYATSHKVMGKNLSQFIKDMVTVVDRKGIEQEVCIFEVDQWLKPNVKTRGQQGKYSMHINKKKVIALLAEGGCPYRAEEIRTICVKSGHEACSFDFRSMFVCNGKQEQHCAVKVPREIVSDDVLKAIDSWFSQTSAAANESEDLVEGCFTCGELRREVKQLKKQLANRSCTKTISTQTSEICPTTKSSVATKVDSAASPQRTLNSHSCEKPVDSAASPQRTLNSHSCEKPVDSATSLQRTLNSCSCEKPVDSAASSQRTLSSRSCEKPVDATPLSTKNKTAKGNPFSSRGLNFLYSHRIIATNAWDGDSDLNKSSRQWRHNSKIVRQVYRGLT